MPLTNKNNEIYLKKLAKKLKVWYYSSIMDIITAKDLKFSYDKVKHAIDGVSFSVAKGEYVAIIGHNGSGKSTLAKLLNGLLPITSGELNVAGYSLLDTSNLFNVRKKVGMVFQNPDNQIVSSIVCDDIAFGPENLAVPREEIENRVNFALSAVGMQEFKDCSPERLSGGQKQRIAIAGALALKPEILVLDESTSMLDPVGRREVLQVASDLNKNQGVTVVAVTHYMEEVVRADRVIVLKQGKIILTGSPREIFKQKDILESAGLELPLASFVAQKLIEKGVLAKGEYLTEQEILEGLCK